jgi:excisionase family DNA binding protein
MNANSYTNLEISRTADTEDLLTKDELAKRLKLKRRGVETLVARKILPVYRISRRCVRFSWKAVKEALAKCEIREVGRK